MAHANRTRALVGAALASVLTLAACEQEGPAEEAGEEVDQAAEEAGEAAEDAADE